MRCGGRVTYTLCASFSLSSLLNKCGCVLFEEAFDAFYNRGDTFLLFFLNDEVS